jgi:hypothetical protein
MPHRRRAEWKQMLERDMPGMPGMSFSGATRPDEEGGQFGLPLDPFLFLQNAYGSTIAG